MPKNRLNIFVAIFYYALAAARLNYVLTMIVILQYHIEKKNNLWLLLLAESSGRNKKRSCWVKKGRTSEWGNKFVNNEVPESDWKENCRMPISGFKELCNKLKPYLQKKTTRMGPLASVETQVASFLYYISDEGRYRKTANSFGISRASVSLTIRRVSYSIFKYLSSDYIRVPKLLLEEVEHSTSLFLKTHGFHSVLALLTERRLNLQAACDYKYCFMDVVVKWSSSVHEARIFQSSSLNKMLKDGTVSPCAKRIVPNRDPVPAFFSSSVCHERVFRGWEKR